MKRVASRRDVLRGIGLAGAAALSGRPCLAAAEPPPETTRLRLGKIPALCSAPQFFSEPLFQAEGFIDTQYVTRPGPPSWGLKALAT